MKAPRSGENCMYARLFTKPVGTKVTQHEPIQRASCEAREAKFPPGKMSAVDFPTFSGHTIILTNSPGRLELFGAEINK